MKYNTFIACRIGFTFALLIILSMKIMIKILFERYLSCKRPKKKDCMAAFVAHP